jgi:hypothetical protein|nr:MAG TPA: hypothetical protein [Caudoviricetes sp.]
MMDNDELKKEAISFLKDLKNSIDENDNNFNKCLDNIIDIIRQRENIPYKQIISEIKKNIELAETYNKNLNKDLNTSNTIILLTASSIMK